MLKFIIALECQYHLKQGHCDPQYS